jgi:hypothetical protein
MRPIRQPSVSDHLAHGPVRGGIPIECDRLRWLALMFDGFAIRRSAMMSGTT